MKKVLVCAIIVCTFAVNVFSENILKKSIAVFPIDAIDINQSDAEQLSRDINNNLTSIPDVEVVSNEKVLKVIRDPSVINDSTCKNRICQLAVGRNVKADILFTGTFYKMEERYSLSLTAIDCKTNTVIWSKDYSCECELNDFIKKTAYAAVIDSRYALLITVPANQTASSYATKSDVNTLTDTIKEEQEVANDSSENIIDDSAEISDEESDNENESNHSDNGITKGIVFGINGRYTIGGTGENECEWSGETFVVMPTSAKSHLRLRFGLPLSTNEYVYHNSNIKENSDLLYSIDHEWGFHGFAITAGISYMYMHPFRMIDGKDTIDLDEFNMFNWVIGIRGGTPNKGFRGRFCFPMPFTVNYNDNAKGTYLEVSAYGMFGNDKIKCGIGAHGAYKRRVGDIINKETMNHYYYDEYDTIGTTNEFFLMAPSVKSSFLIGEHNVITFGFDLLGLIFPDVVNEDDQFSPGISIGYTFSLSPMKRVDSFDGRF